MLIWKFKPIKFKLIFNIYPISNIADSDVDMVIQISFCTRAAGVNMRSEPKIFCNIWMAHDSFVADKIC